MGIPMVATGLEAPLLDLRGEFPAVPDGWSYLDAAATAQKPRVVIEAITRAYSEEYATVHRGVYQRSAEMTERYEAARDTVAGFLGGKAREVVFVRGATEAINLVAYSWGDANIRAGDVILLTELEHHANIVPWRLLADRHGARLAVAPITDDGHIDQPKLLAMIASEKPKLVAVSQVSNVLGSVADIRPIADTAHAVGARILVDGCQAVARLPVDVTKLDCDFYAFSGHKIYGPTGIGALWARQDILDAMPPWEGGGSMIDEVRFDHITYNDAPLRFEAGTPNIVGALGLKVALDWVSSIGIEALETHENALTRYARDLMLEEGVRVFSPADSAGILSFAIGDVHPHDVATILDESGVAIRAGHHCAQPLMRRLGVLATARASFSAHSTEEDVGRLLQGVRRVKRIFQ